MPKVTIIEGGTLVTEQGLRRGDLVLADEEIAAITLDSQGIDGTRIDATGLWVLPGGIDAHTHFEEPDPRLLEG